MRIAWFGHKASERGNGLITYSREVTARLRAQGSKVIFFYHSSGNGESGTMDDIRIGSFNIFNRDVISAPNARRLIVETMEKERVDIAHASLSFSLLDFSLPDLCHDMHIPIAATFHFPYDRRLTLWGGGSRALYRLYAIPLARYDAIIIFSQEQRDILAEYGVPRERIHVIPNGVDVAKYSPGESSFKREIQAEMVFTYCGRLDPEKNVASLLEVFQSLRLPSSHKMVVIGEGADSGKLRRRYGDDLSIIFTGFISDDEARIRILRATDVFILPSEVEGLSLAMLEAMACGLATVATDVGSDGEALHGAGILLDPRGLESQLALALRLLVEQPEFRRSLGEQARQRAVQRFSLQENISRMVELYQELLGQEKAGETS